MQKKYEEKEGAPSTYLLTWDPARFDYAKIDKAVQQADADGKVYFGWNVGEAGVRIGDRVFLMRHGNDRPGLVAAGLITNDVYEGRHWESKMKGSPPLRYVDVAWEVIREHPIINLTDLIERTGEAGLWTEHGTGFLIDPNLGFRVEQIWGEALEAYRSGTDANPRVQPVTRTADELSSYRSDVAADRDTLGVLSDVENLCQVIMAEKWKPPLSIGLFGDWGSGKTSFINLMRQMIYATAQRAGEADKSAFVTNVIQIDFNAWHYMDANLWANLVVRILREVDRRVFNRAETDTISDEFKHIAEHLHVLKGDIETYEGRQLQLNNVMDQIDDQIRATFSKQRTTAEKIATLKATLSDSDNAIAEKVEEVKTLADTAVDKLKLSTGTTLSELGKTADKLSRIGSRIREAWRLMETKKRWWGILLAVPVIVVLLFYKFAILGSGWNFTDSLATATASILAGVVSWKKTLAPHLATINTWLDGIDSAFTKVDTLRRGWQDARQKELVELEDNREVVAIRINALEVQKAETEKEKWKIEERLELLKQGKGLEEFLLNRAGSDDYQKQLGIIALVHKDMKELQLKLQEGIEVKVDGNREIRKYDRVILYIDDLDRCTPRRVVEVLQAVHLLLSIPLFVVVVAVDPRWLRKCLLTHYKELIHENIGNNNVEWAMTPQNYLEKIFQIPFTLPAMASRDFSGYVTDLFREEEVEPVASTTETEYMRLRNEVEFFEMNVNPVAEPPGTSPDKQAEESPEQAELKEKRKKLHDISEQLKREQLIKLSQLPTFGVNPVTLNISKNEKEFVISLLPLLTTPRTTKRMLNVYRLIRVSLNSEEIKVFEQKQEYQAVLVLLAIMYSYQVIAVEFFTDLRIATDATIIDYVTRKRSVYDAGTKGKENDLAEWSRLLLGLTEIDCVQEIGFYQRWYSVVGRFSFQVGHELRRD